MPLPPIRYTLVTKRGMALLLLLAATGCTTTSPRSLAPHPMFPLPPCTAQGQAACAARLFKDDESIAEREPRSFPRHYLELWDETTRINDCSEMIAAGRASEGSAKNQEAAFNQCMQRLTALNDYFNPNGVPADDRIAVALEGGGSKSAPFALGVLAGLQEIGLLESKGEHPATVAVISSVSGGSYAASFLFNRLYDRANQVAGAGDYSRWFASCIPDPFALAPMFDALRPAVDAVSCGEGISNSDVKHFKNGYEFQAQVWLHPNVAMGDLPGGPKNPEEGSVPWAGVANTAILLGETALVMPYQAVARTLFRWPNNSSPTRYSYKNGLERQFGYSPGDWDAVDSGYPGPVLSDLTHAADTEFKRRRNRTLAALAHSLAMRAPTGDGTAPLDPAPLWIIGSSSPGAVRPNAWLVPATRDPLRHQFELTPFGYGSGIYGYANISPQPGSDGLLGTTPNGFPIVDAVVASAGFFDDDQSALSDQPLRVAGNFAQHVTDISWYTEIPNFNAGVSSRVAQWMSPYPFYFALAGRQSTAPYIHLQDGGNSENSGILPVLRRGYKKILFAQSGQDTDAQFGSICHLKNQLELDSNYFITSPELEEVIARFQPEGVTSAKKSFASYLDQICSQQLDQSDLASYDENDYRPSEADRSPTVAKLLCGRLGDQNALGDRTVRDPGYRPCREFTEFFYVTNPDSSPHIRASMNPAQLPETYQNVPDLFHRWAGSHLTFRVYKGDALQYRGVNPPACALLSTIVVLVPAVSWEQFSAQVFRTSKERGNAHQDLPPPKANDAAEHPWARFCAQSDADRQNLRIDSCSGPKDIVISTGSDRSRAPSARPALSCTSLAYLIATSCKGQEQPTFPQDNFIWETWNTTYTMFAAYFDLGRNKVWRAADALNASDVDTSQATCIAPTGAPLGRAPRDSSQETSN